jgi:hypothetical protein
MTLTVRANIPRHATPTSTRLVLEEHSWWQLEGGY